jgi:tripartite-type tricarboxylate transporter receptor subunit TctC
MKKIKLLIFSLFFFASFSQAQEWPNRPIQMIVQFPPGTTTDAVARDIADELSKELNQSVVVMNKAGAGGVVGVSSIAMAKPDGYTIGTVNMPTLTIIPHLQAVTYDPLRAFTHLGVVGPYDYGIFVSADSPWKTFSDLVEFGRRNPNKLAYGTLGAGTTNHLTMEKLGKELSVEWNFIPYKGDNESVLALLGGQVQVINASGAATMPQVKAGKLRMLVSTSPKRWSAQPNVPTLLETGLVKFSQNSFYSLAGPADIPGPIKQRLEDALRKILTDKVVVERFLIKYGQSVIYQSGASYAKFVAEENANWKSIIDSKK